MTSASIRPYRPGEADRLIRVFRDAVHTLAASHYGPAQRDAWAPAGIDPAEWELRLARQHCQVDERGGEIGRGPYSSARALSWSRPNASSGTGSPWTVS